MEFVLLGWPDDGPTLRLNYRRFAYAGKFVMSNTGKAVVRGTDAASVPSGEYEADADVVAAVAFNEDRTDDGTLWLRYVTVREDRKGENLGPRLCAFVVDRAAERGYDRLRIAVNNPFAYEALHEAGFAWTGETTGLAELVLERPADRPAGPTRETYQRGLDRFRERDLGDAETAFLAARDGTGPPPPTASSTESTGDGRNTGP
jgi:GNAT superfamily N-acetyltransferase